MNNSSINKIKIDFTKSSKSYIFDLNTNRSYLDMMGMYSTLAVGYNNEDIFKNIDQEILSNLFKNKITNCEINSDLLQDFISTFHSQLDKKNNYSNSYFCATGALAIEASIKTAFRYKVKKEPRILAFKGSFHGVYGYGGILTDRFDSVNPRLNGFDGGEYNTVTPFYDQDKSGYLNKIPFDESIEELKKEFSKDGNLAAVIVEPIQCTYGDQYIDLNYLKLLRKFCDQYDVPLIFDEIQTGFYTTSEIWYSDFIDIIPDILVFGKKLQVCGILINKKCSKIFEIPSTLEVTWDSNLIDMYRSKLIINYISNRNISKEVLENSLYFKEEMLKLKFVKNYRSVGYIMAFDLDNKKIRDSFISNLKQNGVLCNPTRECSIRLRPHLLTSLSDFNYLLEMIKISI
jgi:L-lysine 6-transaminase